mmetsp:Transcript_13909/g.27030  ORF Transcript_13909/g.27030 Transcript_13909/m.27030 type:complete len:767 (-) Transcript_13909:110-2410(-)|eukprot:CAMPEP_0171508066 /NCGR_PEP_ID=MMETSP0958-20121227/13947_1 /TAXON_ID=87120 /ORGANISM="Aurantiochytrium limacinum, Strain ATCCMYA-1381" /LENGTH=766 /DNA_ID=CAMNT_0012045031 /DNA_START=320 /DNA_END=2620 /DNA_ORIENTATION=-
MQVQYVTPFKDKYQRNNKQTGRKNLRCFPLCHASRHIASGFCGQQVKIIVRNCEVEPSRLRVWAQFEGATDPPVVQIGDLYKESDAVKQERSRQYPVLPWMRGNVYQGEVEFDEHGFEQAGSKRLNLYSGSVTIVVNSERMGWHYQWASNKHTCNNFHVMRTYLYETLDDGETMRNVGAFDSPSFQIFCRRRQRKPTANLQPMAPATTPPNARAPAVELQQQQQNDQDELHINSSSGCAPASSSSSSSFSPLSPATTTTTPGVTSPLTSYIPTNLSPQPSLSSIDLERPTYMDGRKRKTSTGPQSPSSASISSPDAAAFESMDNDDLIEFRAKMRRRLSVISDPSTGQPVLPQSAFLKLMEISCFRGKPDQIEEEEGTKIRDGGVLVGTSDSAIEDFSSNLLGGIVCGFDMNTLMDENDIYGESSNYGGLLDGEFAAFTEAQPTPPKSTYLAVRSVAADLAGYLQEEESFTQAISDFFQGNALIDMTEDNISGLFRQFVAVVQMHVEGYLCSRGISMENFLRDLEKESSIVHQAGVFTPKESEAEPTQRYAAFKLNFLRRLRSETRPSSFPPNQQPATPDFDVSGSWVNTGQDEDDSQTVHKILQAHGYPVFIFQTVRSMLSRFRVTMSRDWVLIQGVKKLMSNAEFLFQFDGRDHSFEIPYVVPLGMPSIPCMYRCSKFIREGHRILQCVVHGDFPRSEGGRFEIVREIFVLSNKEMLQSHVSFDIVREDGFRETIAEISQRFIRVCGQDEYHELLDIADDLLAM